MVGGCIDDLEDLNMKRWILTAKNREKCTSVIKEAKIRGGPEIQGVSK
jgi:hypothetical protein